MNVVSAVFLVVFAVIGICAFVRELTFFIFRNRKNNTVMFVAPISGKCENAEYILRSAAAKVKWISRGRNDCVICLDCGMDDETKRICQKICRDYGFAKLSRLLPPCQPLRTPAGRRLHNGQYLPIRVWYQ